MSYTKEVNLTTEGHYFIIEKDDGDNTTNIQVTALDADDDAHRVEVALSDQEIEEFIETLQLFKKKGDEDNHERIGFHSE